MIHFPRPRRAKRKPSPSSPTPEERLLALRANPFSLAMGGLMFSSPLVALGLWLHPIPRIGILIPGLPQPFGAGVLTLILGFGGLCCTGLGAHTWDWAQFTLDALESSDPGSLLQVERDAGLWPCAWAGVRLGARMALAEHRLSCWWIRWIPLGPGSSLDRFAPARPGAGPEAR